MKSFSRLLQNLKATETMSQGRKDKEERKTSAVIANLQASYLSQPAMHLGH